MFKGILEGIKSNKKAILVRGAILGVVLGGLYIVGKKNANSTESTIELDGTSENEDTTTEPETESDKTEEGI